MFLFFFIRYLGFWGCLLLLHYPLFSENRLHFAGFPCFCEILGDVPAFPDISAGFLDIVRDPGCAVWDPGPGCEILILVCWSWLRLCEIMYSIFTYLMRLVFDNIYEFKMITMLVRIDTKNWLGNYNSTVKHFQNQQHLDNYLSKCYSNQVGNNVINSKIIGVSIIQD